jgi:hypothetical protein
MNNNSLPNAVASIEETANYHQQLLNQYSDPKVLVPNNPDTPILMPYNGYYTLNTAKGAFFAIDANMIIRPTATSPEYDMSLLISLDGTSATRFAFTGTFDGTHLIQKWTVGGLAIQLTFSRPDNGIYGATATCEGSIALPGASAVSVAGSTYNNPIPASLYKGDYYYTPVVDGTSIKVMSIGDNNKLMYDNGTNDGNLQEVVTYVYNLNMYYFSLIHGITGVKLIMGTAATKGFACNNMSTLGNNLSTRSLSTIPKGVALKPQWFDATLADSSHDKLANFSGYYQIPTEAHPLAFVSVQAQYISLASKIELDLNFVMISYSLDGITSTGFLFDALKGMTFDTTLNTLMVPATSGQKPMVLSFNREYNKNTGALVSLTGNIDGTSVSGNTLFNPVPLSAFGGVTMTNNEGDELTINNDNSVTYASSTTVVSGSETETDKKTATYNSLIYVPLMYIVAAPADAPTFELSLGTDGLRGNTSIVIEKDKKTTAVYAINGPE